MKKMIIFVVAVMLWTIIVPSQPIWAEEEIYVLGPLKDDGWHIESLMPAIDGKDMKDITILAQIAGYPVVSIEFLPNALGDFPQAERLHLPSSIVNIAEGSFDDYPNLTIVAEKGSYAWSYAKQKGMKYSPVDEAVIQVSYCPITDVNRPYYHEEVRIEAGSERVISADMTRIPAGHQLVGSASVKIIVDETGTASGSSVLFLYQAASTPAPVTNAPTSLKTNAPTNPPTATPLPTLLSGKESYGDFEYQRYSNGDAVLVGYKGSATELLIPARLAGYPVIAIGQYAFVTNRNLTTVTIPEGVREIGEMAFYDCSALKSVSLPESLEKIEKNAFCECKSLRSISIPNAVKQIDDAVFFGCNNLSDIQIQANHPRFRVENGLLIDKQDKKLLAYEQGDQKTEIFIPGSIEHIGDRLFYGDDLLKYVHIPSNVDNIGLNTLNECKSVSIIAAQNSCAWEYAKANGIAVYERKPLEIGETRRAGDYSFKLYQNQNVIITKYSGSESAVTVPATLEGYKVAAIGDNAFSNRDTIVTLQLPSDIVSIGEKAFYDCDKLTTLNIPGKVNRIGQKAFASCEALKTITISSNHPYYKVQDGMLIEKKGNTLIAYTNGAGLRNVDVPAGVTSIGNGAFYDCDKLEKVTLPTSVTKIEDEAFYSCDHLTSVYIPTGVQSIGANAFRNCGHLVITTPMDSYAWKYAQQKNIGKAEYVRPLSQGQVASFGDWEYKLYQGSNVIITKYKGAGGAVTVPQKLEGHKVVAVGDSVFDGSKTLTGITIPEGVTSIGKRVFYDCDKLGTVKLPDSLIRIDERTFYDCDKLKTVKLPDGLTSIGDSAFYSCTSLTSIELPASVTSIGSYAFYYCTNLTGIELPARVTSIGSYAFAFCSNLTSIELPDSLISIGADAFWNCNKLSSINIPLKVSSIGVSAFSACDALKTISISSDHPYYKVQDGMLIEKKSNTLISYTNGATRKSVSIPTGVVKIGNHAFFDCDNLTSVTIPNSVTSIGDYAFYGCSALTFTASRNSAAWQYAVSNSIRINELKTPTPRPVITKAPTATPKPRAIEPYDYSTQMVSGCKSKVVEPWEMRKLFDDDPATYYYWLQWESVYKTDNIPEFTFDFSRSNLTGIEIRNGRVTSQYQYDLNAKVNQIEIHVHCDQGIKRYNYTLKGTYTKDYQKFSFGQTLTGVTEIEMWIRAHHLGKGGTMNYCYLTDIKFMGY